MRNIAAPIQFFLTLSKTQSILSNRFDRSLGGLSFSEFLILFHIDQAEEGKMRRVDLAEKIGMTASGVTRILLPMEKIHLIKSGPVEKDARVRCVVLSKAGKEKLEEALERLDILAEDIIPEGKTKNIEQLSGVLIEIGGRARMA